MVINRFATEENQIGSHFLRMPQEGARTEQAPVRALHPARPITAGFTQNKAP